MMYKIKTQDKTFYTEDFRYIRLHKNGCYVACAPDVAEGICAKVYEEKAEVGKALDDTVFVFAEGGMLGIERVCETPTEAKVTTTVLQDGQDAQDALTILVQAGAISTTQAATYRAIIEQAMQSIGDEIALAAVPLFPEWAEGVEYAADQRVKHQGVLYCVLTAHTSQVDWTPDAATSLFAKVLIPDENAIPEWEQPDSTNSYMTGDKVTYNGVVYESLIDNNVWAPDAYPAGWKAVE